ncbi:MAG: uracil-DNA glycosylase [Desulfosoma sp.]|uniref:uracil-DNA glycosylase n=1 Tax=Desulfosoma sp. TaxID=2603217 RepID=UPI0040498E16
MPRGVVHAKPTVYCPKCAYFATTWDPRTPYACRAWGIRTREHPSLAVCASSGYPCQLFREKPSTGTLSRGRA